MTLGNLIQTALWPEVKAALLSLFPHEEVSLESYERVFRGLRLIVPGSSDMRICVETTFREGLDDEPFDEVVGRDGTLNRDLEDFKHWGEPESALATQEVRFSLALRPWDGWLGMSIDPATLERSTAAHIVSHCLWEMTFYGCEQAEIAERRAELNRRAAELDAMTEEEKAQRLVPSDGILEELETKPERPN